MLLLEYNNMTTSSVCFAPRGHQQDLPAEPQEGQEEQGPSRPVDGRCINIRLCCYYV